MANAAVTTTAASAAAAAAKQTTQITITHKAKKTQKQLQKQNKARKQT